MRGAFVFLYFVGSWLGVWHVCGSWSESVSLLWEHVPETFSGLSLSAFRVPILKTRTWRNFSTTRGSWKSLRKAKLLKKNLRRGCFRAAREQSREQIRGCLIRKRTADPAAGHTRSAGRTASGPRTAPTHFPCVLDPQLASRKVVFTLGTEGALHTHDCFMETTAAFKANRRG